MTSKWSKIWHVSCCCFAVADAVDVVVSKIKVVDGGEEEEKEEEEEEEEEEETEEEEEEP